MSLTLNFGNGSDGVASCTTTVALSSASLVGRSYGDMCSFNVIGLSTNYININEVPDGLSIGDEVLLINLYGKNKSTGTSPAQFANAGNYETFRIQDIDVGLKRITVSATITKNYGDNGSNVNITSHPVMLQRVPNYSSFTLENGGSVSGSTITIRHGVGGMFFMRVGGTCLIKPGGSILMNARGAMGGVSGDLVGDGIGGGYGGGGWAGTCGGGGGGYATHAQYSYDSRYTTGPPNFSDAYGTADLLKLYSGSGGGCGYSYGNVSPSGDAGGTVFISATELDIQGTINCNGGNGAGGGIQTPGAGSGGSIRFETGTLKTSGASTTAVPGTFGNDGGDGRIAWYYSTRDGGNESSPTSYKSTDVILPYYISGIVSEDCDIWVLDQTGNLITSHPATAGYYNIANLPNEGPFSVMGIPDSANRNVLAFKNIISRS